MAALLGTSQRPAAGEPPTEGTACRVPALKAEDDSGLLATYDGVRLGLEEANLPRICWRPVAPDDAAGWGRVAAEIAADRSAFAVVFGRRAAARWIAAPHAARTPTVYVDVATVAAGRASPPALEPPVPSAVVRAETPVERWGKTVRDLLPARPRPVVRIAWSDETAEAGAWRRGVAEATGLTLRMGAPDEAGFDAILDVACGLGETRTSFETSVAQARARRIPLLSTDRSKFGRGAAVVLVPDHALLGRVAAEAARRLAAGEGVSRPLALSVTSLEVWVDLEAADAEGLKPPLPFLARADRLRRGLVGDTPEPAGTK
jgi:hypothetical protein